MREGFLGVKKHGVIVGLENVILAKILPFCFVFGSLAELCFG